jgi:hypothetical protein
MCARSIPAFFGTLCRNVPGGEERQNQTRVVLVC